ncbi:MAG: FecR family protein [Treponema sp.]|jgi:hypothetical protein|nr:FecR family protein [Treponema sp.]
MKKIIFIVLISSIAVFTAYSQSGKIRELSGEVELKLAGTTAFVPAQVGSVVAQDTIVSTGFKSTAIIEVGSNVITVRPLTRLSLSEIKSSADAETLNINLQAGRIRVDVKPPAGTKANTTVQSPSATASVRGTSFDMDIKNLAVNEGRVAWGGADGIAVSINPGRLTTINSEGNAESPVEVTTASVLPPSPVGTTSTGKNSGENKSSNTSGSVDIEITY